MMVRGSSSRRLAGSSVSRSRMLQMTTAMANSAQNQNTLRQGNTAMIPAPIDGATTGTRRNTAMMFDIALAIAAPSKRSRMTEVATTRAPAEPMPQMNRATSNVPNVGASAAPMAPPTKTVAPMYSVAFRPKRSARGPKNS